VLKVKVKIKGHVIRALLYWHENRFLRINWNTWNYTLFASSLQSTIFCISTKFARWQHDLGRSLLSTIALSYTILGCHYTALHYIRLLLYWQYYMIWLYVQHSVCCKTGLKNHFCCPRGSQCDAHRGTCITVKKVKPSKADIFCGCCDKAYFPVTGNGKCHHNTPCTVQPISAILVQKLFFLFQFLFCFRSQNHCRFSSSSPAGKDDHFRSRSLCRSWK